MYCSDFKTKSAMKLDVHRSFHTCPSTKDKLCVVEGKISCLLAWQIVFDVSQTDFYRHASMAASGSRAQCHGGSGHGKMSSRMTQAVQTVDILLQGKADPMPHRGQTLPSGVRAVQKIIPSGNKWKHILKEINHVRPCIKLPPSTPQIVQLGIQVILRMVMSDVHSMAGFYIELSFLPLSFSALQSTKIFYLYALPMYLLQAMVWTL